MNHPLDLTTVDEATEPVAELAVVELYDPPMCCPTGLCGPTLDQALLEVNEMILALQAAGISIVRYQMTSHPHKFLANDEVMRLVRDKQMDALPVTTVRGAVVKDGAYPSLAEIQAALNGTA